MNEREKRNNLTLQPSHNFFTELLTFMPLICCCIALPVLALFGPPFRSASEIVRRIQFVLDVRAENVLLVVGRFRTEEADEKEGNIVRAVRRRESAGRMIAGLGDGWEVGWWSGVDVEALEFKIAVHGPHLRFLDFRRSLQIDRLQERNQRKWFEFYC